MKNREWKEIWVELDSIEIAPQDWPVQGQWRVRVWHSAEGTEAFGYMKFDSREEAHEYAKGIEVREYLGRTSVGAA